MSIRDVEDGGASSVKHYKIRLMDNGGYYISPKIAFNDINSMIKHYQSEFRSLKNYFRLLINDLRSVNVCVQTEEETQEMARRKSRKPPKRHVDPVTVGH